MKEKTFRKFNQWKLLNRCYWLSVFFSLMIFAWNTFNIFYAQPYYATGMKLIYILNFGSILGCCWLNILTNNQLVTAIARREKEIEELMNFLDRQDRLIDSYQSLTGESE